MKKARGDDKPCFSVADPAGGLDRAPLLETVAFGCQRQKPLLVRVVFNFELPNNGILVSVKHDGRAYTECSLLCRLQ